MSDAAPDDSGNASDMFDVLIPNRYYANPRILKYKLYACAIRGKLGSELRLHQARAAVLLTRVMTMIDAPDKCSSFVDYVS
jgi:hypothetical protein